MRHGKKLLCVDSKGMEKWIVEGHTYEFSGLKLGGLYMLSETGDVGYYPYRFVEVKDDYDSFMDRVLKPVDLGQPVSA